VIAGAGEVGSHLAKLLSNEEQDIVVVDNDAQKLGILDSNYNLMTCVGSPVSFATLADAGAKNADLFIAVTPYEDKNVTACAIAHSLGAKRSVARIDNYEFMAPSHKDFFNSLGVSDLIYPEYLAAKEIITALKRGWVRNWFELSNGEIILIGVKVRENAPLVGKQLKELTMTHHNFHVSAIKRRRDTIIPGGDDIIAPNDILYITTTPDKVEDIRQLCNKQNYKVRRVMIMGGGRIAVRLAAMAQNDWKIKILESDIERCRRLPELCPECEIINADGRDTDVLIEEGIAETDAFIALTDSSETNILTCMSAKEYGVHKTIAEVESIQLIYQAEGLNIGTIINKKLLASSRIFQILLDLDTETSKFLSLAGAEVAELEVKEGCKISRKPVKDLKLSRDMTIGGLVRNGKGMLVTGNTVFEPGDKVVVFCLSGQINKIKKLLN
ncbi:MAG: Trk system potassium transporter TrkA, partial [Muribaculaceae bacterium]|nr:Trk system potassium transporter TrkA [Muribaculaceae bacterium]